MLENNKDQDAWIIKVSAEFQHVLQRFQDKNSSNSSSDSKSNDDSLQLKEICRAFGTVRHTTKKQIEVGTAVYATHHSSLSLDPCSCKC